ncbi:MAG: Bax inhibitor-1/YccA family protein [Bacteroidota bacterium]|nr:Bax inhibitor-1/YccA family protein [Bacteroidota bacterium]
MALFESGNPTLSQKFFNKTANASLQAQGIMSVRGTLNKFGFLMMMVIGGAVYTWHLYDTGNPTLMSTLMMVGIFGGLIAALGITFKPTWAGYLAPAYGILEGFFIGGLSAVMNDAFKEKYPGLIMQAVGLTFGVAIAMFLLYNFRIIKATEKFKSIIITATMGIAIFYLLSMVVRMFGVNMPFLYDASPLGIGISLFVVAIAALNLIIDFDMIERGSEMGAPRYMEWYGAFGLLVTLVWLYIEILKLLSRFAKRD